MAVVQGIREKVHLPLYDSLAVKPREQLFTEEKSGILKFFVNVQGKTKLETNLQSASLLPHYNTFEARAMRVVISDLPPLFPDDVKDSKKTTKLEDVDVLNDDGDAVDRTGGVAAAGAEVTADIEISIQQLVDLYRDAKESDDGTATLAPNDDESVTLSDSTGDLSATEADTVADNADVVLTLDDIKGMLDDLNPQDSPPPEQLDPNNGSGTVIGKLVYNTVTSLFVGEKVMISMPTWFFPAGAGPYSETGKFTTHGEPTPSATFRFAEPIYIDKQQNFRVEIEIPDSDTLKEIQRYYGPLNIWVVLDGYMTRDVQ